MKSIRFDRRRCCCFDSISQTIEKKVERIKAQQSATSSDKIAQLEPMIISLWDIAPARERKKTKRKQRKKNRMRWKKRKKEREIRWSESKNEKGKRFRAKTKKKWKIGKVSRRSTVSYAARTIFFSLLFPPVLRSVRWLLFATRQVESTVGLAWI